MGKHHRGKARLYAVASDATPLHAIFLLFVLPLLGLTLLSIRLFTTEGSRDSSYQPELWPRTAAADPPPASKQLQQQKSISRRDPTTPAANIIPWV